MTRTYLLKRLSQCLLVITLLFNPLGGVPTGIFELQTGIQTEWVAKNASVRVPEFFGKAAPSRFQLPKFNSLVYYNRLVQIRLKKNQSSPLSLPCYIKQKTIPNNSEEELNA